ncbi:MAG TPA: HEAT repeat domain-containing protein [Planctomycetota bacterium]|nr:HEAT repeat domain-containing protein [Planctomycetota bacterium]
MRKLLALSFLALVAARDAEFDKAKAEFRKALAEMQARTIHDAADRLADTDQKAAVDALLDGYGVLATQIKALWTEKVKWVREKEATGDFKIDMKTNPPTIPASDVKKYEAYLVAEKSAREAESRIMNVESARRGIVKALGRFKSDASVKELLQEVVAGSSSWQRRAGVAEALGQMSHAEIPGALAAVVKKDSEPQVRIAAMDALRELKANAADVTAALVDQLKSEFWQVKATAAATIRALMLKDAVDALIDALGRSDGRLKAEFNDALVGLTGVDKHGDVPSWKAWWEGNRDAVLKGSYVLKAGEGASDGPKNGTTFYGIPVTSRSVVFALDRSGSMLEPSEWDIPKDVATGGGGKDVPEIKRAGNRKIDIARWQLKRTLAMMPDGAEFNIIFFNHEWVILSDKMLKLSAGTRKTAYEFIDKLEPVGGTNIYDPLEKGMAYATAGEMREKLAKSGIDTIFFLTDGLPNSGQVPLPADILTKVRELNKTKKVKINTVGVFSAPRGVLLAGAPNEATEGGKLLKQLAEESGGKYTSAGSDSKDGTAMPAGAGKKKP